MSEIDPELRDKIIETHTLVKRIDEDHKEHKSIMNARLREANLRFEDHKKDVFATFKEHEDKIKEGRDFRIRVLAYATAAAGLGGFLLEPIISIVRNIVGL